MSTRPVWLPKATLPRPPGQSRYAYRGPRAPKPSAPPAPEPSAPPAPVPWSCAMCAQQNYGFSTVCAACGAQAPDWTCQICTLENHGSSVHCVACGFERGYISITLEPVSAGPTYTFTTQYTTTVNALLIFLENKTGQPIHRMRLISPKSHQILEPHRSLASYGITSGSITYVIDPVKGGRRRTRRYRR